MSCNLILRLTHVNLHTQFSIIIRCVSRRTLQWQFDFGMRLASIIPVPRGSRAASSPLTSLCGSNAHAACLFGCFSCFSRVPLRDGETPFPSSQRYALSLICRYHPAGVAYPGHTPEPRIRPVTLYFHSFSLLESTRANVSSHLPVLHIDHKSHHTLSAHPPISRRITPRSLLVINIPKSICYATHSSTSDFVRAWPL